MLRLAPWRCHFVLPRTVRSVSTTTTPQAQSSSPIPVINFSPFLKGSRPQRETVGREIVEAFKTVGFVYLSHTGVCEGPSRKELFESADRFFSLPGQIKASLAWKDPRANRGYVAQGRERVTQATDASEIAKLREISPDFKESMEIGREDGSIWKNEWPNESDLPGFKKEMLNFFESCHELHLEVMRSLALGLGLPYTFFDNKCNLRDHNLRLLNYPSAKRDLLESGGSRAGAHSDYGTITLVYQDAIGGLEVQDPSTHEFISAPPIEDTIVVNVGDLLSRWSNNLFKSTLHRVVLPQEVNNQSIIPRRQSIAFFASPNAKTYIEALPGTGSPKYPPVRAGDYIVSRLAATYS